MRYRGLYIDECETDGIIRENEGEEIECNGILFTVYADSDYQYDIENFVGAYGFEMENNRESIENFVRSYIDFGYSTLKEMQFKAILEQDYNDYKYDVLNNDYFFDVIDRADEISNVKRIYECLKNRDDIPIEHMEYIISLKRPLENIVYSLKPNENQFAEDVKMSIESVVSEKECCFGYAEDFESADENVIDKIGEETHDIRNGGIDMC